MSQEWGMRGGALRCLAGGWIQLLIAGLLFGVAETQQPASVCRYYGRYKHKNDLVRDVCPPPSANGVHYFVLDIDPGLAAEVVMHAYIVSPADAVCARGNCSSPISPGYDLFAAENCLPTQEFQGLTLTNGMIPNVANTTLKPLLIKMASKGRLYIGMAKKLHVRDESESCSVRLVPGALDFGTLATGSDCVMTDYNGTEGADGAAVVYTCTKELGLVESQGVPVTWIAAAVAGGGVIGAICVCMIVYNDMQRKKRRLLHEAEDRFRTEMLQRAKIKQRSINKAPIDVAAAHEGYRSTKVAPWRDHLHDFDSAVPLEDGEASSSTPSSDVKRLEAGWGVQASR